MNSNFETRILLSILLIGCIVCVGGCYPDWPEHSGTAQVEGEVLLDGMPLRNSKVVFVPARLRTEGGKLMPIVYGECDAMGVYQLKNADGTPEILAGEYNVMISLVEEATKSTAGVGAVASQQTIRSGYQSRDVVHNIISRYQMNSLSEEKLVEMIDQKQSVPAIYNRESNLYETVEPTPGKLYIEFDLSSVDSLLKK